MRQKAATVRKLVALFLMWIIAMTIILVPFQTNVNAANKVRVQEYLDIISRYYEYVNGDEAEKVVGLYGDKLQRELITFFGNRANRTSNVGLFGVESVQITKEVEIGESDFYEYYGRTYSDVKIYFVQCQMSVSESNKYYSNGVNYFKFYIGKGAGDLCIFNLEIPTEYEILSNATSRNEATRYIDYRNQMIFGVNQQCNSMAYDSPIYSSMVANPLTIRVLLPDGSVDTPDFKTYCKCVAGGEITTLHEMEALEACAMAIKMFAIHSVLRAAGGGAYDITSTAQTYIKTNTGNVSTNYAVDQIYNLFLLDSNGCVFPTFYRRNYNSTDGEYCIAGGGILAQLLAEDMAKYDEMTWKEILKYYYQRKSEVTCYNPYMAYGSLIFTTAHRHSFSYEAECTICGADEIL